MHFLRLFFTYFLFFSSHPTLKVEVSHTSAQPAVGLSESAEGGGQGARGHLEDDDGILTPGARTNGLGVNSLAGLVRAIETVVDVSQSMTLRKAWPLAGSPCALAPEEHSAERAACGWPST